MDNSINKRVCSFRKLAGLTQAETAEKMNMKCSTYSQMERKGKISAESLILLAKIFGIKPEVLLFGGSVETPQLIVPEEPKTTPEPITFEQPKPTIDLPPPFIPTKNEENYIKILRMLKPEDRDEIIKLLEQKYKSLNRKSRLL